MSYQEYLILERHEKIPGQPDETFLHDLTLWVTVTSNRAIIFEDKDANPPTVILH